jgi:hypothetical protein
MQNELNEIFGREVDLVEKDAIRNPFPGILFYVQKRSSMQPEERDAAYLWDILDSAETILKFTPGSNYDSSFAAPPARNGGKMIVFTLMLFKKQHDKKKKAKELRN